MSICIHNIANKLKAKAIVNVPEHTSIQSACIFDDNLKLFNKDILYIFPENYSLEILEHSDVVNLICLDSCVDDILFSKNLNILSIPNIYSILDIHNIVTGIIDDDFVARSSLKLYESLASNKGIQNIIDCAVSIFNNPVLVANTMFKLLAHSEMKDNCDELWLKISEDSYYPKEYINHILKNNLATDIFGPNKPAILSDTLYGKRFICKKIEVSGKPVGFVTTLEHNSPFKQRDILVFEVLCNVLSCELSKLDYLNQSRGLMYEYFISELLDNNQINKDLIAERLDYIDLKLSDNLFVLTTLSKDNNNQNKVHFRYICNDIEAILPNGKCIVYKDSLTILLSSKKNNAFDNTQFSRLLDFLKNHDLICGMSRRFSDISEIKSYYEQACEAIHIGMRLESGRHFYEYAPYSFYHLLDTISNIKDIKSFCNSRLLEIISYDKKYQTNYTYTLYVYLLCNQNPTSTAQELGIHRNTIDYRINKISELFNIELKDSNVVFSLNYSFRILYYLGELKLANLSSEVYY